MFFGAAVHHRLEAACLASLLLVGAQNVHAQRGALHAIVVDPNGSPVPGVEVSIASLNRSTRSDSLGRVVLASLPRGLFDVSVRRFGYHAWSENIQITGADYDSVKFTIEAQPVPLSPFDINGNGNRYYMQGFDQRRATGMGNFLTREQIEKRNASSMSDLFRTMPAVRLVRTSMGMGVRFASSMTTTTTRGRGSALCVPMMWIDGQKAPGMEVDDLRTGDIEGIELYRGPSVTPPQFSTGSGNVQCGTIVVWTRHRG